MWSCHDALSLSQSLQTSRFPGEIIGHAVWLDFRFPLSHYEVEELLFVRGVIVSYEAIRRWYRKFGQAHANGCRVAAFFTEVIHETTNGCDPSYCPRTRCSGRPSEAPIRGSDRTRGARVGWL